MPSLPPGFQGTWIQSAYNNYVNDGTVSRVKQLLDVAIDFRTSRNVPVYCGEFGVFIPNSDPTERTAWYKEIRSYLNEHNIPWTMWDYTGGFGVFEPNSNELFEYDLNVPLLEALQLDIPPQKTFSTQAKTNGLMIYDDYAGEGIQTSVYGGLPSTTIMPPVHTVEIMPYAGRMANNMKPLPLIFIPMHLSMSLTMIMIKFLGALQLTAAASLTSDL